MTDGGTGSEGFEPTVTPDQADRIRRWHEATYQAAKSRATGTRVFSHLGLRLEVPPDVMPITPLSEMLGQAVLDEVRPEDRVLDMGTGSGVDAILAASQSMDVVAVDVNPHAVETAAHNVRLNSVSDRVDVRLSDVFGAVDGVFDLIIFNPPSRWFPARDLLEVASTDEDYCALRSFVGNCDAFLSPGGRVLIFFGTSGDLGYLRGLLTKHKLRYEEIAHRRLEKDRVPVDYYVHRVTRS